MQVRVKIKSIETINTDTEGLRENQPLIEVTLELVRKEAEEVGAEDKVGEVKFSEMLSNLAGMSEKELEYHFASIIEDYVKTALKGQALLTEKKEWVDIDKFVGAEYTIEV